MNPDTKTASHLDTWQEAPHARAFDNTGYYPYRHLRRYFEACNDIRLLLSLRGSLPAPSALEVGCATGELFRFLRRRWNALAYRGVDVSEGAIRVAQQRYGTERFSRVAGDLTGASWGPLAADLVVCRDVVMHQVDPYGFMTTLCAIASRGVVLRLRTRDHGATVLDPDVSCQYHYESSWVPFLVLNTEELVAFLSSQPGVSGVVVARHYVVLGGANGRFLPKDLYTREAKTAVTSVLVEKTPGTERKGGEVRDQQERLTFSLPDRALLFALRRMKGAQTVQTFREEA